MRNYPTSAVFQSPQRTGHHHTQPHALTRPLQGGGKRFGEIIIIALIVIGVNTLLRLPEINLQHQASSTMLGSIASEAPRDAPLFLLEKASLFVSDVTAFEDKVKDISSMLGIAPEWLMAVMYSESKFDASVENLKGSGATGLIQFMDATAHELNISTERLRRMNHLQQLEYVYLYLQKVRERYGDYTSLTDLYLAVLYPKARGEDYCYTLYAKPSQQYLQNAGLDENKDGRVTVSDIEKRMQRLYPTAFIAQPAGGYL